MLDSSQVSRTSVSLLISSTNLLEYQHHQVCNTRKNTPITKHSLLTYFSKYDAGAGSVDKAQLIADVRAALYASKVCSYAQGYNIIRAKSAEKGWGIDLAGLGRIWKGGCIIRAQFLDLIKQAYLRNPDLPNLLVDPEFAKDMADRQAAWRRVVQLAVGAGIGVPGMTSSLAYFDTYRRGRLPANLVQAQRDFFGSHTYERTDMDGAYHTVWDESFGSYDSITTTGYNQ